MFGTKKGETELAAAYAQKFWDAGNFIITLIFVLAFAVYAALAASCDSRRIAAERWLVLLPVAVIGNVGLWIVLWRLVVHESRVLKLITDNSEFIDSIESAYDLRKAMLLFNTLLRAYPVNADAR